MLFVCLHYWRPTAPANTALQHTLPHAHAHDENLIAEHSPAKEEAPMHEAKLNFKVKTRGTDLLTSPTVLSLHAAAAAVA